MDNIKEDLADEVDCLKPKTDYMKDVVVIHSPASLEAFWLKIEGKNKKFFLLSRMCDTWAQLF